MCIWVVPAGTSKTCGMCWCRSAVVMVCSKVIFMVRTFAFGRCGGTSSLHMILLSACLGGFAAQARGKQRFLGRLRLPKPHRAKVLLYIHMFQSINVVRVWY